MRLLGFVFLMWGLILSLIAMFGHQGGMAVVGLLIVGWAPSALLHWFVSNRWRELGKVHARMLDAAGVQAGSGADHAEDGTGIAINRAAKTLSLLVDGVHKTYPFSDVRQWESRMERAGQVVGVGLQGGLAAIGANAGAARDASAHSGFYVTVRDVDRPKWRIAMRDQAMQDRWMEILRQEIGER